MTVCQTGAKRKSISLYGGMLILLYWVKCYAIGVEKCPVLAVLKASN